jgi:tryptophan synthase alpha chain
MTRIASAFETAASENRAAFIPFLTAGFPTPERFLKHASDLLEFADILEVGLPFSDPLGDGPTIQKASEVALGQGVTTESTFQLIRDLRSITNKPLMIMTYYNPIYCYPTGERGFVHTAREAGADGLILPDLPPEEAVSLRKAAMAINLDTVFLVAPTSTTERIAKVTSSCSGFVYAVSVTGVTGARTTLPPEVPKLVSRTRELTALPVAVGFGVSNAATAHPVAAVADGVVVGSALIHAIRERGTVRGLAEAITLACKRA